MRTITRSIVWVAAVFLAVGPSSAAGELLINGNWSTGDETGWTRWHSVFSNHSWSVTGNGPTPPEGTLTCQTMESFGWYQVVGTVALGSSVDLDADWSGSLADGAWAEVRLFSVAPGTLYDDIVARIDSLSDPDMVADRWGGLGSGDTWGWESVLLSSTFGGNGGTIVNSEGWIVVALSAGSLVEGSATVSFDNVTLTPEPATMGLLGLGLAALAARRKRRT